MNTYRTEIMLHIEDFVDEITDKYLHSPETMWQAADYLPDSQDYDKFIKEVAEIQEAARELSYDFFAVLVADTITEEALPTYEAWLMCVEGINQSKQNGWSKWVRKWTSEENRHGDLLNKYLYLSGRIDMRQFEISTQYLIADGFDLQTDGDPYKSFVYTSFQELATQISHRRVGTLAKQADNTNLAKMCGLIASDEGRHAKAYMTFVQEIFKVDPSEMMIAFATMMKRKIVMPAHNLRQTGVKIGETFTHFSNAAQRLEVYTSLDYIAIMEKLINFWEIDKVKELNGEGEKARDFLMTFPNRMKRIVARQKIPNVEYEYKWILPQ